MTAALYARRKKWPLESVTVRLHHSRIHAVDCTNCETKEGKIDRIDLVIELQGSLSEEQRLRLSQIAERCPVRRTLESEIEIRARTV
ncbi:MAG TPA: OsmC family protein [Thermoanaerobaculia bacterium]|jgi:putative redox protein|nr:OsmC family protein [Thermoanaerobaculia bacterium]